MRDAKEKTSESSAIAAAAMTLEDCIRIKRDWLLADTEFGASARPDMVQSVRLVDIECQSRYGVTILRR